MIGWLKGLFRPVRIHHRSAGPVRIDPDKAERIHIVGKDKK
ncbi:hypothetical protein SEA_DANIELLEIGNACE_44 [Arthrobacter phage DanielleIgnace]|nr:hypothetical protein SEA_DANIELLEIGNACE_44 [Arthrobacter phage DanielleIgnace]